MIAAELRDPHDGNSLKRKKPRRHAEAFSIVWRDDGLLVALECRAQDITQRRT